MGILEREALEEHLASYEEGYREGFRVGVDMGRGKIPTRSGTPRKKLTKKRKLSDWNKFVKANSKKPRFIYRNGKLNLKKMGVAFRKTPAGKKRKR